MASNEGNVYAFLSLGFAAGLFSFFKGFRVFREYRVLEDTPLIPLRSVAMGLVHVHGKATANEYITSPVTWTRCCFYKVDIEKWKTEQRGGRWEHYCTDQDGVRFYLDDNSGKVMVDARGAELDLLESGKREVGGPGAGLRRLISGKDDLALMSGAMPTDADLLSYVGAASTRRAGSFVAWGLHAAGHQSDEHREQARLKAMELFQNLGRPGSVAQILGGPGGLVEEALLASGPRSDPKQEQARLAMLEAFKHPAGSAEFTENMRRAAEAHGADPQEVQRFINRMESLQDPSAAWGLPAASGRYRFTEYCILPDHWYDVTGTCTENPGTSSDNDRNLIVKGEAEPTFLISRRPAQGIEKHLRRRAALMIFGGAALSVVCLGGLLAKLGLL
jgi:hypothetical protein